MLPDYNTTRTALRLSNNYATSDLFSSCCTKNNLEPASKSKNKQEQVDKQTAHRPCPKDKSDTHEVGVLNRANRVI